MSEGLLASSVKPSYYTNVLTETKHIPCHLLLQSVFPSTGLAMCSLSSLEVQYPLQVASLAGIASRMPDLYAKKLGDTSPAARLLASHFLLLTDISPLTCKVEVNWNKKASQILSNSVLTREATRTWIVVSETGATEVYLAFVILPQQPTSNLHSGPLNSISSRTYLSKICFPSSSANILRLLIFPEHQKHCQRICTSAHAPSRHVSRSAN